MSPIHSPTAAHSEFSLSQVAEDWLFAYANARHETARATMWPHLVEAVEELITESRRLYAEQVRER